MKTTLCVWLMNTVASGKASVLNCMNKLHTDAWLTCLESKNPGMFQWLWTRFEITSHFSHFGINSPFRLSISIITASQNITTSRFYRWPMLFNLSHIFNTPLRKFGIIFNQMLLKSKQKPSPSYRLYVAEEHANRLARKSISPPFCPLPALDRSF